MAETEAGPLTCVPSSACMGGWDFPVTWGGMGESPSCPDVPTSWPLSSHCCTPRGSTQQYFHKPLQMWVQCYWLQKGFGAQMGIKAQFFLFSPGKHWPGGSADSWVLWGQDHTTVHGWGLALTHRLSKSLHFPRDSVSAQGVQLSDTWLSQLPFEAKHAQGNPGPPWPGLGWHLPPCGQAGSGR